MFLRLTTFKAFLIFICLMMFASSPTAMAKRHRLEIMHAFAFAGLRQDEVEYNIKEGCEPFRWPGVILKVERYAITDEQIIIDLAELRIITTGHDWSVPDTVYIYDITILTTPKYCEAMYDWSCEITELSCLYVRGLPQWLLEAIKDIEPTIFFIKKRAQRMRTKTSIRQNFR